MIVAETTSSSTELMFAVLAIVLLLGPFLIARLGLPATIGLVLGGAIVGPEQLGWLEAGQIDALGDIGLLYLMFMAGLELDLLLFRRYRNASMSFGVITFTCPFVLGVLAGLALDYSTPTSVLLGSIWASHTLVSLAEVKQAGLMSDRAVAMTVSATALTDTLALIVLAVVTSGAVDDPGGRPMVDLAIGLALLAVYAVVVLPKVGPWIFRTIATDRASRLVFLIFAFSSAALIADHFGIEGLVGAFLAGLGVNRLVPAGGPLAERVEFLGNALFVPAFLVYVGTQLDLAALTSVDTLGLACVFLGIVAVGKGGAALITGRMQHLSWPQVGLMGSLSLGQAAATLAAALVGQSVGLFTEQIMNAVLVTVMATILLSALGTAAFARRIEPEASEELPLTRAIVVHVVEGVDEGELCRFVARLAAPASGRVIPTRIVDRPEARRDAQAELDAADAALSQAGGDVEGVLRFDTSLVDGVLAVVDEQQATLVVQPWTPAMTASERFLGGALEEIGRRSPVPVVLGSIPSATFDRIVLVIPGRTRAGRLDSQIAADVATQMRAGDEVELVVVAPDGLDVGQFGLPDDCRLIAEEQWDRATAPNDLVVTTSRHVRDHPAIAGAPGPVLVAAAPYRLRFTATPTRPPGLLGFGAERALGIADR